MVESPQSIRSAPDLLLNVFRCKLCLVDQVCKLFLASQSEQIIEVTLHSPGKTPHQVGARIPVWLKFEVAQRIAVKQRKQVYPFTLRVKLAGHFESYHAAQGVTTKQIWTSRLHHSHLLEIVGRHLFDTPERRLPAVKSD